MCPKFVINFYFKNKHLGVLNARIFETYRNHISLY